MKSCKSFLCAVIAFTMLTSCGPKNDISNNDLDSNANNPAVVESNNPTSELPPNNDSSDSSTFSYSDGIDDNGFCEGIVALDYVELFNYNALPVPTDVTLVSEESIQAEIDNLMTNYSSSDQIVNRAVADGDTVNIDYVGSVDGVEFDGGSTGGNGTEVTIGVTSYIDDFLEQLIGHMPGETFNVEVTFPDVYQEASLQGKDAVFVTTINHIVEKSMPELNDDFVKSNFMDSQGWDSIAKMKEGISADIQKRAVQQYVSEYLVKDVNVRSVPDKLIKYQEDAMLQYYRDGADYYQMDFDEFLSSNMGISSKEELIETNRESNLDNARYTLVVQAVAEDAKISVTEEDMLAYFIDYSSYEAEYGLPYLKQIVLFQKVVDYISDNAVLA